MKERTNDYLANKWLAKLSRGSNGEWNNFGVKKADFETLNTRLYALIQAIMDELGGLLEAGCGSLTGERTREIQVQSIK